MCGYADIWRAFSNQIIVYSNIDKTHHQVFDAGQGVVCEGWELMFISGATGGIR